MESLALSRSFALGRISLLLERKDAMGNMFLTSTRDLLFMTKPRIRTKYELMSLTDACQAHVETVLDLGQELTRKNGKPLTIKEIERRRKISETKKGSIAWNKGRKHSEETIQRIRERTREALSDPKVRKKMRGMQGTHSKKVKELISTKLKQAWYERRKQKHYQDRLHRNWAEIIATTAKIGGYGERELDWDSYYKIKAKLSTEPRKEKKMRRTRGPHSEEVKEQIRTKMKQVWYERHKQKQGSDYFSYSRKQKRYQDMIHGNWAAIISATAKTGGYGERELDWDSYYKIREEFISEAMKEKINARIERKKKIEKKKMEKTRKKKKEDKSPRDEILAIIKEKKAAEKEERRRERDGRVKMKIHAKNDRLVKQRLTKLHLWKKRLEIGSSSKEIVPDRIGDEWDIEFTKERIGIGISLSDQLQLVKDRRKAEEVPSE